MTDAARWLGILPSLPTLFDDGGEVDVLAFRRVVRFAAGRGADGVVCFGLAGEVGRLTLDERERLLDAALDEVGEELPVLVGCTAEHVGSSRRLARHAERLGAAGLILPPPTAYRLGEPDLVDFFVDVAQATNLPVLVQDAPEYLGVAIRPEVVVLAAERAPNICGVKLETTAEGMERWRGALGASFSLYGGSGGVYLLDCLRAGAEGIMPGVDTVDLQAEILDAERDGHRERADELFTRLLPLLVYEMQSIDHYNACAKHVLNRRGVNVPRALRRPGPTGLPAASVERLDAYLRRLGIAAAAEVP